MPVSSGTHVAGAAADEYMPDLRFRLDTSYDNSTKIDELLRSPEVAAISPRRRRT